MKNPRTSAAAGFTLMELLVVVVIIAVLATLTITISLSFRKQADRTWAMNAMRQIQLANISYSTENNGSFVPPKAKQVDASGAETGVIYQWFENPDFISQIKGPQATFAGGGAPDLTLPATMMDRAVIQVRSAGNTKVENCFGYTAPSEGPPFRQAQLSNPANSAAFLTCDDPFVDHATKTKIAYRHQEKALVVYYDGRAAILTKAEVDRIDANGGASNAFWNAAAP